MRMETRALPAETKVGRLKQKGSSVTQSNVGNFPCVPGEYFELIKYLKLVVTSENLKPLSGDLGLE